VLLRAGETFDLTSAAFGKLPANTLIGSFGEGRAKLTGQQEIRSFENLTVESVRFEGSYDPTSTERQKTVTGLSANNGSGHLVFYDCEAVGLAIFGWARSLGAAPPHYVVSNCAITNWQVYGMFVDAHPTFGITGCSLLQNPDGYSGRTGGPIRFTGSTRQAPTNAFPDPILNIQQCEMFSNSSTWPKSKHLVGMHHQPCLRWNTTGELSISGNITGCIMEGGAQIVQFKETGGFQRFLPQHVVMENNILVGTERTLQFIDIGHQGQTIRNNTFVWVDVPYWGQGHPTRETRPERFVVVNKTAATKESTDANNAATVRLHNNLAVDLHATAPRDVWPDALSEAMTGTGGKVVFRFDLGGNRAAFGGIPADAALSGYVPHYKAVGTLAHARGLEKAPNPGTDTPKNTPVPLPPSPRIGEWME
jgi:hypothetical protein